MFICNRCREVGNDSGRCPDPACGGRREAIPGLRGLVHDRFIARGSFGGVHRCHTAEGVPRAVKLFDLTLANNLNLTAKDLQESYDREWRTLTTLVHPNVITLHDHGEGPQVLYLVLDWLPNTVAMLVQRNPQGVALAQISQIGADLADALAYVHAKQVLHRDLKPGNLGLGPHGELVLFDFGIARAVADPRTLTFVAPGSLLYGAPEQLEGEPVGPATDVYGWGAVMYYLLAGRAHRAATLPQHYTPAQLSAYLVEPPVALRESGTRPPALDELVLRCLGASPGDRPQQITHVQTQMGHLCRLIQTGHGDLGALERRYGEVESALGEAQAVRAALDQHQAGVEARLAQEQARLMGLTEQTARAQASAEEAAQRLASLRKQEAALRPWHTRLAWPLAALGCAAGGWVLGRAMAPEGAAVATRGPVVVQVGVPVDAAVVTVRALVDAAVALVDVGSAPSVLVVEEADPYWIAIEGGRYKRGSEEGGSDERRGRWVTVPSFEIGRTEVTVAQYRACVEASECAEPRTSEYCNWGKPDRAQHPINCVSWENAQSFAEWKGARLPTEAEWEYAASSRGAARYPWGDTEATCAQAVMDDKKTTDTAGSETDGCGRDSTWPVCSKPKGQSAQGVCDLAGNVWEWVEDVYASDYEQAPVDGSAYTGSGPGRVYRGGGWIYTAGYLRAANRNRYPPGGRSNDLGFRLARTRP